MNGGGSGGDGVWACVCLSFCLSCFLAVFLALGILLLIRCIRSLVVFVCLIVLLACFFICLNVVWLAKASHSVSRCVLIKYLKVLLRVLAYYTNSCSITNCIYLESFLLYMFNAWVG